MTPGATRSVFLSYRREDTRHLAGRLADWLTERLGSTQVFMDVTTIEPGADFAATIAREVAACDVLVALIGATWATIADARGRRRLDDPDDIVVLEIQAALEREILVIPVLVDGAVMPNREDLPEGVQGLARRNAVRVDHETFHSDIATLLDVVERSLPTPQPTYKDYWDIPGGYVNTGETPGQAAAREVREELGIEAAVGPLLVADWAPHPDEGDKLLLVFDGGTLTADQLDGIQLQADELASYTFRDPAEATGLLIPRLGRRVAAAIDAHQTGRTTYLECGIPHVR